jgi:hypothetical protein
MDKFSHTILYANYTNIIVTSTTYNDLQKKGNFKSSTHFWMVSFNKTLTHALNIILDNQILLLQSQLNSWECI